MKDAYARQRIEDVEKEFRDRIWRLQNQISDLHRFLGVEQTTEPQRTFLVKVKHDENKVTPD